MPAVSVKLRGDGAGDDETGPVVASPTEPGVNGHTGQERLERPEIGGAVGLGGCVAPETTVLFCSSVLALSNCVSVVPASAVHHDVVGDLPLVNAGPDLAIRN